MTNPTATTEQFEQWNKAHPQVRIVFLGGSWHLRGRLTREPLQQKFFVAATGEDEEHEEYDLKQFTDGRGRFWKAYVLLGYTPTRLEALAARR
jgi:hypothetical protein